MNAANAHELKRLESQLAIAEGELKDINKQQKELARKRGQVSGRLSSIRNKIKSLKHSKITVSEHALLRYLQRVKGINLEEINREILTE